MIYSVLRVAATNRLLASWVLSALIILTGSTIAECTIVRFNTVLGPTYVRLYNTATPLTTANFLNYVNSGRYSNTIIHRSIPGFVVQGGGFTFDEQSGTASHIAEFDQVLNEPGISNLRGTIAMAKLAPPPEGPLNGGPNSATSEWFFNLSDSNPGSCPLGLDCQNGGFTAFGRVVAAPGANPMVTVDAIAALPTTAEDIPLRDGEELVDQLVFVTSIQVLNLSPGDYDFNGPVATSDYNVWKRTYGSTIDASADGNGNGIVDTADYLVWRMVAPAGSTTSAEVGSLSPGGVPEPATALLLVLGGLFCAAMRRRPAGCRIRG